MEKDIYYIYIYSFELIQSLNEIAISQTHFYVFFPNSVGSVKGGNFQDKFVKTERDGIRTHDLFLYYIYCR